jgi:hypothetical protein
MSTQAPCEPEDNPVRLKSARAWKQKYYPVAASQVPRTATLLEMTEHALRKWRGLRPKVLARYDLGLVRSCHTELQGPGLCLPIHSQSCVLCRRFINTRQGACQKCPLFRTLGRPCDQGFQAFYVWSRFHDPEPMIKALELTRRRLIREQKKKVTQEPAPQTTA